MKNNTVARVFTYRLKCILLFFILVNGMSEMLAAQARPQDPTPLGLFQRLIKIKYSAELYLISVQKNQSRLKVERVETNSMNKLKNDENESLDSALAIYNTIRWNVDGLVYQLSGDLVAANSPKKLRKLNDWCLKQNFSSKSSDEKNDNADVGPTAAVVTSPEAETLQNLEAFCKKYLPAFSHIGKSGEDPDQNLNTRKNINLTTNVFYLIKDSYSLIKGLSDLKTQKTMALVEMLDQMRLASPQELIKQIK